MYAELVIRSGRYSGRSLTMQRRKILAGSGADCALRIRGHGVAAHHCALFVSGGALAIHNLANHGKTYVDGRPIKGTQRLDSGDTVRVGPLTFEVQFDPAELARTALADAPETEEMERRTADSSRGADRLTTPQGSGAQVVGVCKSKQWNTCGSPSDAAAGALKQFSRHD